MVSTLNAPDRVGADRTADRMASRPNRRLGFALVALGAGVALNTVLGPLMTDSIHYPFSETLRNQPSGWRLYRWSWSPRSASWPAP